MSEVRVQWRRGDTLVIESDPDPVIGTASLEIVPASHPAALVRLRCLAPREFQWVSRTTRALGVNFTRPAGYEFDVFGQWDGWVVVYPPPAPGLVADRVIVTRGFYLADWPPPPAA